MSTQAHGSCLCGKVKLVVPFVSTNLSVCHCHMCRKWSAGPLMTLAHSGDIAIEGEEYVNHYNSSEWAERAFCQACGSHLFYHLKGTQDYYFAAWIFDDVDKMEFTEEVFIDNKPNCYAFANHTHQITEAEIMAMAAENFPKS